MNTYEEWKNVPSTFDEKNPYSAKYTYPTGDTFYVEPVFHLKLEGFKNLHPECFQKIIDEMERLVKSNHLVVFIGEEGEEITSVDNAIYLTVEDVCNPLQIFVEDKSRGSDYGD